MRTTLGEQISAMLTDSYQSESAIVRAVYSKRDSEITDDEWQAVLQALRTVGHSKNIGRNEYIWRTK